MRALFERTSRGLRVTPYGETVREYAHYILNHVSLINSLAEDTQERKFTVSTYPSNMIARLLTDFYKKYFEGTKTNCVFIPHSLDYIPREVSALESKKINYMIIDPRNNYRIDEKSDNRNLNEYEEQPKKAYTIVKQKTRVEKIKNDLET